MTQNFINIDLDDPKTGLVAEALSNKTCVKILSLLAEQELTASDVASKLEIPLNTTGYNLDKLIASGLVEKSSKFFWSVKGKKTPVYRVANKKIIITPKKSSKSFVPATIISGVFALILKYFIDSKNNLINNTASLASESVVNYGSSILNIGWIWFLAGAIFSLIVATLWDWISYKKLTR